MERVSEIRARNWCVCGNLETSNSGKVAERSNSPSAYSKGFIDLLFLFLHSFNSQLQRIFLTYSFWLDWDNRRNWQTGDLLGKSKQIFHLICISQFHNTSIGRDTTFQKKKPSLAVASVMHAGMTGNSGKEEKRVIERGKRNSLLFNDRFFPSLFFLSPSSLLFFPKLVPPLAFFPRSITNTPDGRTLEVGRIKIQPPSW